MKIMMNLQKKNISVDEHNNVACLQSTSPHPESSSRFAAPTSGSEGPAQCVATARQHKQATLNIVRICGIQ